MNSSLSFSIYTLPPLISMLFLFSLSIVSFFSGHGKAQWKMLSMFSLLLGMASLFAFLAINNKSGFSIEHLQMAPLFGIFSIYFAMLYAFLLTGQSELPKYKKREIPLALFFIIGLTFWGALFYILRKTNWLIKSIEPVGNHHFKITYGPLFFLVVVFFVFGLGKILINLHRTFKKTTNKVYKEYLFLNIIAFRIIYGSILSLVIILPLFGLDTQILIFFAFPIGVLLIYIAILRYQFGQIDELNANLENKVLERTHELENTQALLVQSKTMASVGQLAAGLAHEINNPVGAVQSIQQSVARSVSKINDYLLQNQTNLLQEREFVNFFKVMDNASRITLDGTKRITEIVKAMRNFSNLDEADEQLYDIHEGLNDTIRLVSSDHKKINIDTNFSTVPRIMGQPAQLNQVFWNIMQNAIQAVDSQGVITISTRQTTNHIVIEFADNGRGIPESNMERIFEPGFTTRGVGVGTGLGLSICYKIVREHGGAIDITSKIDQGTTVTLQFPLTHS